MWNYLSGVMASLGGCTLPVLSVLVAKLRDKSFNRWAFLLQFSVVQFLLFLVINLLAAGIYSLFQEIQPLIMVIAALVTLTMAVSLYLGKPLNVPYLGGIYGLALSPCSVGFLVAVAASSVDYTTAVLNSLSFTLGLITPIVALAFLLSDVSILNRYSTLIEKVSILLLVLTSYYLAYLAGSSWRWVPW